MDALAVNPNVSYGWKNVVDQSIVAVSWPMYWRETEGEAFTLGKYP